MPKWIKDFFSYLRFLWDGTLPAQEPRPEPFGLKFVESSAMPPDKILLVNDLPIMGPKEAVLIDLGDRVALESAVKILDRWEAERSEEVRILSIKLWTEGSPCEHSYRLAVTSKEHESSVRAKGNHKDYVCSKCGHSLCSITSEDATNQAEEWKSISGEGRHGKQ